MEDDHLILSSHVAIEVDGYGSDHSEHHQNSNIADEGLRIRYASSSNDNSSFNTTSSSKSSSRWTKRKQIRSTLKRFCASLTDTANDADDEGSLRQTTQRESMDSSFEDFPLEDLSVDNQWRDRTTKLRREAIDLSREDLHFSPPRTNSQNGRKGPLGLIRNGIKEAPWGKTEKAFCTFVKRETTSLHTKLRKIKTGMSDAYSDKFFHVSQGLWQRWRITDYGIQQETRDSPPPPSDRHLPTCREWLSGLTIPVQPALRVTNYSQQDLDELSPIARATYDNIYQDPYQNDDDEQVDTEREDASNSSDSDFDNDDVGVTVESPSINTEIPCWQWHLNHHRKHNNDTVHSSSPSDDDDHDDDDDKNDKQKHGQTSNDQVSDDDKNDEDDKPVSANKDDWFYRVEGGEWKVMVVIPQPSQQ